MVRGIALLPHGVGKEIRTLVFCQGDAIESAKQANNSQFVVKLLDFGLSQKAY